MKVQIIISTFLILTLVSCTGGDTQENQGTETPKALEDKNSSYQIVSKRSYEDMVESLYKELVDKNPELKELETQIKNLSETRSDSTKAFSKYNAKSQSYYSSVGNHTGQIKDSILRDKMKTLVANSLARYNTSISRYSDILKSIETKKITIADLHTVLKITRTLSVIEKYQMSNLPAIKPLEKLSIQHDDVIKYADSLIKK